MEMVQRVINDAVNDRELPLMSGLTVAQMIERVAFGLYSMTYGGLVIRLTSPVMSEAGFRDPISTMHHNCNALVDSFGWKPMYEPLEYQTFLNRITPELKLLAESRLSGKAKHET